MRIIWGNGVVKLVLKDLIYLILCISSCALGHMVDNGCSDTEVSHQSLSVANYIVYFRI
jgi:hypothetical protein